MSGRITIDGLSDSLKEYLNTLGLNESQVQQLINKFENEKIGDLSTLTTENKTVVAAINELFQNANNGKELIATAIGEPLNSSDTFSAMSTGINGLNSQFKTALMNNGVSVESADKFKQLIEKLALLADSEGKGIQYASGDLDLTINNGNNTISLNLDFTPTYIFFNCNLTILNEGNFSLPAKNIIISNISDTNISVSNTVNAKTGKFISSITSLSNENCTINTTEAYVSGCKITGYYAIGIGEEDTTLLNSLKSVLVDESVEVADTDTMADLIVKTDNEFDNKNNEIASNKQALVDALNNKGINVDTNCTYSELVTILNNSRFITKVDIGENILFNDSTLRTFTGKSGAKSTLFTFTCTTFEGNITLTFNAWGGYTNYSPKCYVDVVRGSETIYSYSKQTTSTDSNIISYDLNDIKINDVIKITLEARYSIDKVQRLQDVYIKGNII